ncbi:MAG: NUDIX domain-containing protein [Chlorobi bacterium]|nr:NUDIX domain-containing protein [Chlorobiota bacterium]
MKEKSGFIIRVYGILINNNNEVLLSDEFQLNMKMTKFPGGGLEQGEGTIDCLKREAIEELGQKVKIVKHLYTTDYYQEALFFKSKQLLSIYYLIELLGKPTFKISAKPFDFNELKNGNQSFRWKSIQNLQQNDLTFPIDKKMVEIIKSIIVDKD